MVFCSISSLYVRSSRSHIECNQFTFQNQLEHLLCFALVTFLLLIHLTKSFTKKAPPITRNEECFCFIVVDILTKNNLGLLYIYININIYIYFAIRI